MRVVKTFTAMYYEVLRTEGYRPGRDRLVLFVAGDGEKAKAVVSRFIEEIGFDTLDTGSRETAGASSSRVRLSTQSGD